jgi:hypothetical protein
MAGLAAVELAELVAMAMDTPEVRAAMPDCVD